MTVNRLIWLSTSITLFVLAVLIATLWSGFRSAKESAIAADSVALPALVAMLETRFNVVQVQQFLTDVSATGDSGGFDEAASAYRTAIEHLDTIASLQPLLSAQIKATKDGLSGFHNLGIEMAKAYISDGREAGNAIMKHPSDGFDAQAEKLTENLESLEKTIRSNMTSSAVATQTQISRSQNIGVWLGIAAGLLMIGSGVILYRQLIRIIGCEHGYAASITQQIAQGDLTQQIQTAPNDRDSLLAGI